MSDKDTDLVKKESIKEQRKESIESRHESLDPEL